MKSIIVALIISLSISAVSAQSGFEMFQVPDGAISATDTKIEARIENWGYHKIFVALPSGWIPDDSETAAQSYPIREEGLWRIYGLPDDPRSLLGMGEVFKEKSLGNKITIQIGTRYGWWLKPNEGAIIKVKVNSIGSGTIDPQKIEKENPGIRVISWYQEFTIELSSPGFITAPWIVENATLVSSSPAPYSSELGKETVYYDKYTEEIDEDIPKWDEWFTFKNSLAPVFSQASLVPTKMKFAFEGTTTGTKIVYRPVWRVDSIRDIFYAYEWKRGQEIEGIVFWRDQILTKDIPAWFRWF